MRILIFGNGWLGNRCAQVWSGSRHRVFVSTRRIKTTDDISTEIEKYAPDVVLNAAGIVGKPNVDWCEDHQLETFVGNVRLPMMIASVCKTKNIYMLHIGTGCIYYGYKDGGWKPEEPANPIAVYTKMKYAADLALSTLPNVGIARIRMPIDSRPHPGNLIDKLISFEKVVDVENSVTVVEDMVYAFERLLEGRHEGIFHVVNPGTLKTRDLIEMYETFVDATHKNEWITADELQELGLAKKTRSNNVLNTDSLKELGIEMTEVNSAVERAIIEYANYKMI